MTPNHRSNSLEPFSYNGGFPISKKTSKKSSVKSRSSARRKQRAAPKKARRIPEHEIEALRRELAEALEQQT
ncbi:MAG TPA: hypothetical protein VGL11_11555, partial [Candidatus Binatia bacterium]